MIDKMSNKSKPNNGMNDPGASSEFPLPSSCPISKQDRLSRHQITADRRTRRRKWSQEENGVVMQFYDRSEYGRTGYRKRMHVIWNEMGMFSIIEQRLVDKKNNIFKRKWLSDLELEEIQRNIEDNGNGEMGRKAM